VVPKVAGSSPVGHPTPLQQLRPSALDQGLPGTLGGNNHGQVVGWAETADGNGESLPEAICHFRSWPYVRLGLD
jgi:hypothetical protein